MIDFSMILVSLLQLWWLLLIIIIIAFIKSPTGKGVIGEGLLNIVINIALDKKKYQLLKNVTLATDNGTTQIDHIIVSRYGIFVIETKNYKGWIFGSEHSKTWTQSIYGKKHSFLNPLHQNYKHVKTLQKLLKLDENQIFSIVVFVGESTFKTNMPENVVYPLGLLKYIKSHTKVIFSQREMWRIVEEIEDAQLVKGFKTNIKHVQNLKKNAQQRKIEATYVNTLVCPRCGNELVLRVAKRGANAGNQFYGCKGYPRCKYTKNIGP